MSYVVLARKWRPMRFEDLVGQDHVARTLANAITADRVAHAFLFTGVRGVGKTTSARILAKTLNCSGAPGSPPLTRPPTTPCLLCAPCLEIATGADVDVREIDGASYNGIDEVRKLQDSLPYRPARDRYKIIIVDEVHMLSNSAWNAFLKTLEEPPPHVKFIFATTEAHKIPITILSRVQRFDFKLISSQLIKERLRHVIDQEGVKADDAALGIIAREAAGSMRDAMSLLDQVIAWSAERLTGDEVARVLGVASHAVLHQLARALVQGEAQQCLEIVRDVSNQGFAITPVTRDFLALLRDLVVAKLCASPGDLLDLAEDERRDVSELAARVDADDLIRLHQGFSLGFDEVVKSGQPRAALEMLLVRLARRPPLVPLDDLVLRLASLERRLTGGPPRGAGGGGAPPPRGGGGSDVAARPRSREGASAPAARAATPDRRDEPPSASGAPAAPPQAEPPLRIPSRVQPAASERAPSPAQPAASERAPQPRRPDPGEKDVATGEASARLDRWAPIVEHVRQVHPGVAAFLEHGVPLEIGAERVVLGWEPGSPFVDGATTPEAAQLVARALEAELGAGPSVEHRLDREELRRADTLAARTSRARAERETAARERALGHPRVRDAMELLGARVKDLRLPES